MRSVQLYGLSDGAVEWMTKHCKIQKFYQKVFRCYNETDDWVEFSNSEGHEFVSRLVDKSHERASIEDMNGETLYDLHQYELKNDSIVEEYVQADVSSSGPCIFLALRFKNTGKPVIKSLWSDDEIDNI